MRWLLAKDVLVLRRSPVLSGLLVIYPILLALLMGAALSSSPAKPRLALYSALPHGERSITLGGQSIDISETRRGLGGAFTLYTVPSRAAAIGAVRTGQAAGALILPADLVSQVQSLVTSGLGRPTIELYLNMKDPVEREFVQGTIDAHIAAIESRVSQQVLRVAIADLQQVLNGGRIELLGQAINLLGLRNSRAIVHAAIGQLPPGASMRAALGQVVAFADLAIQGLSFANPVLGSIGQPLTVRQVELAGATTPLDSYAAAIAVTVSLMIVALLLAAGTLALERAEQTLPRLLRTGLSPLRLLTAKTLLGAGAAAMLALLLSVAVSAFLPLGLARLPLWLLAIGLGTLAFAALGTLLGTLVADLAAASLLVVLVALPIAFTALVPADAVAGGVRHVLDVVAFVFPFRATLGALAHAFTATGPGLLGDLVHLAALAGAFLALARWALR